MALLFRGHRGHEGQGGHGGIVCSPAARNDPFHGYPPWNSRVGADLRCTAPSVATVLALLAGARIRVETLVQVSRHVFYFFFVPVGAELGIPARDPVPDLIVVRGDALVAAMHAFAM